MFIKNERIYPIHRTISVSGGTTPVPPFAQVAWASLVRRNLPACPADGKRFPVVLDPAFSHNLVIKRQQTVASAGLAIAAVVTQHASGHGAVSDASGYLLERAGNVTIEGVTGEPIDCPAFAADLWLHSKAEGGKSVRFELHGGFTLYPVGATLVGPDGPSLPLLGALALYVNDMKLVTDYKNLAFSLGEQV